ncbi:MAG: formylmethanofuran--tetrahydromethanopterin N-formyltransferase, partial [Planctomycetota bacterium]
MVTINDVPIDDTFAEAFPMTAARLIVTAATPHWALTAGQVATGYASSVIGCDAEAGIERWLAPEETPDGRPGVSLLFFGFSRDALQKALINRVGQSILTCATTACYNGLPLVAGKNLRLGGNLRYFGDGWQQSKLLEGQRFWRLPTMDGEFVCADWVGSTKGVGGGNFLILAETQKLGLYAAERAVEEIRKIPGVIMPFPGGVVRS